MNDNDILSSFQNVRCWSQNGQRAPHKPLLLLLTLARVQRGEPRLLPYADIAPRLAELHAAFGPMRRLQPQHPFWRLRSDAHGALWEVPEAPRVEETTSGDARITSLKRHQARGGFPRPLYEHLSHRPDLVNRIVAELLVRNFPPSLHEDVLDAIGLPWIPSPSSQRRRDPSFRPSILTN